MTGKQFLTLALGLTLAGSALAADPGSSLRSYVNVGPQYTFADDERISDDGLGVFAGVGTPITRYFGIEGGAFYETYSGKTGGSDWDSLGFEVAGLITYPTQGNWVPYLVGAIGTVQSKDDNESSWDPHGAIGLGLFKYFKAGEKDLGLRFDVRYRGIDLDGDKFPTTSNLQEVVARIGLVIPFGPPLGGDEVETVAAPAAAAEAAPVATKAAAKEILADVYFAFNSDKLNAESVSTLNGVISTLKSEQTLRIVLKGHTDNVGSDGYNQALSERRALVVRNFLTTRGISSERLTVESYGESRPAADNSTDEGRAKNRRVEVRQAN